MDSNRSAIMALPAVRATDQAPTAPDRVDPGLADAATRRRLSGPALRTFVNVAERWGLSEAERLRVLGLPGRSTYYGWLDKARHGRSPALGLDVLLRISAVLGIHKALRIVFASDRDGRAWLRAPNRGPTFGGQRPLDLVTSGTQDGLLAVRRHLDAWRGGQFAAPNSADAVAPLADADIVIV
jgi:uncharacterized protein (DUF2384 family)